MRIGMSLLDRNHIECVQGLIEDGIDPTQLTDLEIALRAFLVSKELGMIKAGDPWSSEASKTWETSEDRSLYFPFSDHLLDYEFVSPDDNIELKEMSEDENTFLAERIEKNLKNECLQLLRERVSTEAGALSLLDDWYAGELSHDHDYDSDPSFVWDTPEYRRNSLTDFLQDRGHAVFHSQPQKDAAYIVRCYHSGIGLYSKKPIVKYCKEHVFWEWPDHLFRNFESKYMEFLNQIRGPGSSVFPIPPVMLMVLQRARTREDISRTIVEMRDEYAEDRRLLWEHLEDLWSEQDLQRKHELVMKLNSASRALFSSVFPATEGAFSLALDVAENLVFGGFSGIKSVAERLNPTISVAGISLVHRLSVDFRKHLADEKEILRRHLTRYELQAFGID